MLPVLLLVLSVFCILLGEIRLWKTKDLIEYALPYASDAQTENGMEGSPTVFQALPELQNQMQSAKLTAALARQDAEISAEDGAYASCTLYGITGDWLEQHGEIWVNGRAFTPEEQAEGKAVALVNQAFARQLWQEDTDAIDRTVMMNGRPCLVVGILQDSFPCDGECYIPMKTVSGLDGRWDVQILSAENARMNAFRAAAEASLPGGTLYSLQRERVKAGLVLRYTCVAFLVLVLKDSFTWICFQNRCGMQRWKKKQELRYPGGMIAPSLLLVLQALLLWALWGMAALLTLRLAVYPAYVFPEVVPSIPIHLSAYVMQLQRASGNMFRLVTIATKSVAEIRACGHLLTGSTWLLLLAAALTSMGRKL